MRDFTIDLSLWRFPTTLVLNDDECVLSGIDAKKVSLGGSWASSEYGRAFFDVERSRLEAGMRQCIGPSTLQVGSMLDESVVTQLELPYHVKVQMGATPSAHSFSVADIAADPAFLPFTPDSFHTVLLPHVLESHFMPHQVLREAHRVLQAEGYVIITGFSPSSLVGLQRWVSPKSASPGRYYTASRVIDWLHVLGFEVVASAIYQYSPISRKPKIRKMMNFLESVGDRWLPMFGGGYMIAAKKKELMGTPIGRLAKLPRRKPKWVSATARSAMRQEPNLDHQNKHESR